MTSRHRSSFLSVVFALLATACRPGNDPKAGNGSSDGPNVPDSGASGATTPAAHFPLAKVADVDLPGKAVRFDYQDIDAARGQLVIAHMNDASVVIVDLKTGSPLKVVPNVPVARGVVVGSDVGRIFVTSSPNQVVILDSDSLDETGRVTTGESPDGVAWDPMHKIVATSDQGEGAVSLLANAGTGARKQVPLGVETGNVIFDATRGWFWVTVVTAQSAGQLVAIDPLTAIATTHIELPGCEGAHGLRLHPDAKSAVIACEGNNMLARVELEGAHAVVTAETGDGPDVLSVDPALGWIYVSAESGDLTVFDLNKPGLVIIDKEHVGDHAHSVAVDPATHRVYFPLMAGPKGTPVLRIMRPAGLDDAPQ